jgi:hypothetical protein
MRETDPAQSSGRLTANDKKILRAVAASGLGISWGTHNRAMLLIYGPALGTMERYSGSLSCRRDTLKRLRDAGWLDARYRLTDRATEALSR